MARLLKPSFQALHLQIAVDDLKILFGLAAKISLQLLALVPVMEQFHRLFQADGNHQPENNGGNVDEEVAPGGRGVLGRVNVQHGVVFLRVLGTLVARG